MRFFGKKRAILALTVVATLVAAVGAYAYWTTTGSGTGSATVASSNGTVTLHASFANGLTPGGSKTVSFTADNAGSSNLYVGTVTSVVSVSNAYDATTNPTGCKASWFSIPAVGENQVIPAGSNGLALTNSGTITFNDSGSENQDGCKGATVTLTLSSN
jgi:hypothetical protein